MRYASMRPCTHGLYFSRFLFARARWLAVDHLDEKQGTEDAKWLEDKRKLEEKVLPQFHRATVRALES
jgi:hypothetical protein